MPKRSFYFHFMLVYILMCLSVNAQQYKDSITQLILASRVDTVKAKLYLDIARNYYESTDYRNAKLYIDSSFEISKANDFIPGMIDYYFVNGRLLKNSGKLEEAIYQYEEALALSIESNDKNRIAGSYNNLGNVYVQKHDYKPAYEYLQKSVRIYKEINEIKKLAYPLSNIGKIHLDQKQYDSAIYYYNQTIEISTAYDDHYELAQTFKRMASIYYEMGDFTQALNYCDKSLNLSYKYNYRYIIADDYDIQAKIYLANKDYKNARKMLHKCLEYYKPLSLKLSIPYCYKQLSLLDSIEGNYKDAYHHFKLYHLYNDSLVDLKNRIEMEKQQVSSKAEVKQVMSDRKNKFLYLLIVFILITAILILYIFRHQQLSKRRIAIAETKNKISQDLHDEIGSTLSSISMQTEVLKKRIRNHENIDDLIDLIKNESRKTMSTMNDIVWSLNTEDENFTQFINRLKNYCSVSLGTVGIHYEMLIDESIQFKNADLHFLKEVYLISKECINNCMKYSACTKVEISMSRAGDKIQLQINDDGIGFDITNDQVGFGGEGIKNMRKRAKSIKADFDLISVKGHGTKMLLSWKDQ